MDLQHRLLFVYGTLLTAANPFGLYLHSHCKYLKKGKFNGKLYDIGHYPGALHVPGSEDYVHGSVWQIDNPDEVLKVLDPYEGISADNPHPQEYTRDLIAIETGDETLTCWVYLYNWPVQETSLIASGDYLQYKSV
ncbi:MAG: gamma-glutamylcyclotransferase [Sphingobacteriales bacterium]|nr:MAG: gamma-glutamylcyclotransferase [Sphingobacteriales bacterium]